MFARLLSLTFVGMLLSACSNTPKSIVEGPLTVRPPKQVVAAPQNGAIYQASNSRINLFEDRIARTIGDTLTISIEEKLSANNKAETKTSKSNTLSAGLPTVSGSLVPSALSKLTDLSVDGSSSSTFNGKGESTNSNTFTGSISVTVVDVLNNGNLVVAGEKQIALNQETSFVRFSGVVDPRDIKVGNTVSSTKVADARIEQRGDGQVDASQAMGWLSKFFLSFLPF
ncbi:flagellar basal body L-ring protein FlgH [Leeia sp. TBRC 13508]|uniref:Flagellar L-ring protein n=1 Tax=Leeia speluncae TaxID=2884804 RepID=A0ABS8D987_9NEIS|nr:flagellar basal body L-ring protein FlgH [Leeia speluncae]MCB6184776.1 flagellar basal body L-ring protein FlgH [Leeia speluncae]